MRKLSKPNLEYDYIVRGLSSREMAPIYDCSFKTILTKLEEFGIPKRTYKENKMPVPKGGHLSVSHRRNISRSLRSGSGKTRPRGELNPLYKSHKVRCFMCEKPIIIGNSRFMKSKSKRFFCGFACEGDHRRTLRGSKARHWQGGDITVICTQCGNKIKRKRSVVKKSKTNRFFCDQTCAGIWKSENLIGSIVYNWKGGYDGYYGESWPRQRRKALERDKRSCKVCNRTQKQLRRNPDVHHIIPFVEFAETDHDKANNLHNLICLCNSCHKKVESDTIKFKGRIYKEVCKEIEKWYST